MYLPLSPGRVGIGNIKIWVEVEEGKSETERKPYLYIIKYIKKRVSTQQ